MRFRRSLGGALVAAWLGASSFCAVVACSSFSSDDAADAGSDGSTPETSSSDALSSADATPDPALDAGADVLVNLLDNPGFESGCGSWKSTNGKLSTNTDVVHGGTSSCKVCSMDAGVILIAQYPTRKDDGGASIAGSVWVRSQTDASAGLTVSVTVGTYADGQTKPQEQTTSTGFSVDGNWNQAAVTLHSTAASSKLALTVVSSTVTASGFCFVLDDGSLTAQ